MASTIRRPLSQSLQNRLAFIKARIAGVLYISQLQNSLPLRSRNRLAVAYNATTDLLKQSSAIKARAFAAGITRNQIEVPDCPAIPSQPLPPGQAAPICVPNWARDSIKTAIVSINTVRKHPKTPRWGNDPLNSVHASLKDIIKNSNVAIKKRRK